MSSTKTGTRRAREDDAPQQSQGGAVTTFQGPRLPWHPKIEETYGVNVGQWKVLCEAIFPAAKTTEAIGMALAYCRTRKLDIFKRPVHIVPMWDSKRREFVETVWPGIAELRTTAFRTGLYAGCDEVVWGPLENATFEGEKDIWENRQKVRTEKVEVDVQFHVWGQMTVYRLVKGLSVPAKFVGPKVYWEEICAREKSGIPNDRWSKNPFGQHEKTIEAAALRRAFPEELGGEYAAEEMDGQTMFDSLPADRVIAPRPAAAIAGAPMNPNAPSSPSGGAGGQGRPAATTPAPDPNSAQPERGAGGDRPYEVRGDENGPGVIDGEVVDERDGSAEDGFGGGQPSGPDEPAQRKTVSELMAELAEALGEAKTAEMVHEVYSTSDIEAEVQDREGAVAMARKMRDERLDAIEAAETERQRKAKAAAAKAAKETDSGPVDPNAGANKPVDPGAGSTGNGDPMTKYMDDFAKLVAQKKKEGVDIAELRSMWANGAEDRKRLGIKLKSLNTFEARISAIVNGNDG